MQVYDIKFKIPPKIHNFLIMLAQLKMIVMIT